MGFIDDKYCKSPIDSFIRNEMNRLYPSRKKHNKPILSSSIDYYQNPIMALLKGPDNIYKKILTTDNEKTDVPIINDQCRDKNSFLQIHVRPLNAKQNRQLAKRHRQSIKEKCLRFTFPITYPCPKKSKRNQPPIINPRKSAVSISFIDDVSPSNSEKSFLNIPSKQHKIRSSNAFTQKHSCHLCGSILSDGICSCIVQYLLELNNAKPNDLLVQFNDIFENLTSNNIIT